MTTAIKRRRGTTTQHSTFTGLEGEITVDTTKDTLVVHDGFTAGGFALLREDLSNNTNVASTSTTQTFTNKTINLSSNTLTGTTAQFNTALSDGDFATLAGTETLSNKTFNTNPTISSGTANGVAYLNGSKVLTTGSVLTFDGTTLTAAGFSGPLTGNVTGNVSGTAANVTGTVAIANGGTGATTRQNAMDALAGATTSGYYLRGNGTDVVMSAIQAADVPTLNQNTTGTASNVTGVVAAANGGTGQSSYAVGDLLYASTTTGLSKLADVATGNALISGGVGVAPSWGKIGLTTHVSGTLGVANGGTGVTTSTGTGNVVLSASPTLTGTLTAAAITASGTVTCNGALAANGGATLGNAAADALTITSDTATVNNTLTFAHDAATTNTVVDVVSVQRTSSGTPANGIGAGVAFKVETTASNIETGATIDAIVTDVTAGSEDFDLTFNTMTAGAAASEKMRLDSVGNLGLGVTPSAWVAKAFQIGSYVSLAQQDDGSPVLGFNNYQSSTGYKYSTTNPSSMYRLKSDGSHIWYTAPSGTAGNAISFTQAMTLDASGNLLVGTTTQVASAVITNNGNYSQNGNQVNFNSGNSTIEFVNRNSGGSKTYSWYYAASGGGTPATLSTSGVWTNSSDARGKENIADIEYGLQTTLQIKPRQFDVKSDGSHAIGFVAQELKEILPEVVHVTCTKDDDDFYGVDYGSITAVLVKAIQELKAELDATKAEVAALKGTVQ